MKTSRALRISSLLLGLSVALAGCGRAPEPAAPKSAEPTAGSARQEESEPATLAEAEAWLDRAKADLDQWAMNAPGESGQVPATAGAPPPAAAPSPPPAPAAEASASRADKSADDEAERAPRGAAPPAKGVSSCETACKAFSSLERASDAVCRLDSDGGQRCLRARQIREDAARRVVGCGCSK